jgi:ABC-type transporter MlaC component
MSQALRMTETVLNKFYGALSDEQKAQFDRIFGRLRRVLR